MNKSDLIKQIKRKKSFLCVGLDTDILKIPEFIKSSDDPIFTFNKAIVDATADMAICFKPNIAFYESFGLDGWKALEKTANYIKDKHPEIFLIADAKRGDIGNTSKMYARAFFEHMNFDAITVSPYMGVDSVDPFMTYPDKWVIILALTSNNGSNDFQQLQFEDKFLYQQVLEKSKKWGSEDNTMYVVGATKAEKLEQIRKIVPNHFLLVPGVGAQGGSLQDVAKYGLTDSCGLLVNASRSIIYAGNDRDFQQKSYEEALKIRDEMDTILTENNLYL